MISRKSMDSGLTWGSLSTVVAAKGNGSQCLVSDPAVIVDTVHNRTIVSVLTDATLLNRSH
eukprot:m.215827 g.215827  ORF g.215827 m.215827 type:complete len:61 (+) comp15543_c0_seq25:2799-2981(+)